MLMTGGGDKTVGGGDVGGSGGNSLGGGNKELGGGNKELIWERLGVRFDDTNKSSPATPI
jgi:hypothetical protein